MCGCAKALSKWGLLEDLVGGRVQSDSVQDGEMLATGHGRIAQPNADALGCLEEWERHPTAEVGKEGVRMFRDQMVSGQCGVGEVPEVGGDYDVRSGANRCRDDLAIVGIRKPNGGDEISEAGHDGVSDMGVHEAAGAFEVLGGQVRPVAEQRPDPLVVDRLRPLRAEEVRNRQF